MRRSIYLHTNEFSSVIAVPGLGAHAYYTWVKKKSSATQQENPRPLLRLFPRRRENAQPPDLNDAIESSNTARNENNAPTEVMWLRDLLPQFLPNARIATYSYESDWRQDAKTNLRVCGEQLLDVLYQYRTSETVSLLIFTEFSIFIDAKYHGAGSTTTIATHWT